MSNWRVRGPRRARGVREGARGAEGMSIRLPKSAAIVALAAALFVSAACAEPAEPPRTVTVEDAATVAGTDPAPSLTAAPPSTAEADPSATMTISSRTPEPQLQPDQPGNGPSSWASLSAEGRFVAYASDATNLVPGDSNRSCDIFVRDRETGRTERISVATDGAEANGSSFDPAISADGRYVAFWSWANNLVPGDDNGEADVFLHDRQAGETELVSTGPDGKPARGGEGMGSYRPSLSDDGRLVAFVSWASDLVPGDTNRLADAFVCDRQAHAITRVSVAEDGTEANGWTDLVSTSADGRWLAFVCNATNLVHSMERSEPAHPQVYLHNQETGHVELVSVSADGRLADRVSGGAGVSADGQWVAFASWATNLAADARSGWAAIYLRDCRTAKTDWVGPYTRAPNAVLLGGIVSLSRDGRWLAFDSDADDLVPGDTNRERDVFVYDRGTSRLERVSVTTAGAQATGGSNGRPTVSRDGRFVAFVSRATNLAPGIREPQSHIYVRDRQTGRTELVSCRSR